MKNSNSTMIKIIGLAHGVAAVFPKVLVNKNICIVCGAKMPPGKAGRKCKKCR